MSEKTVIIGGVAGGATAAARLRRRDEAMEIIIFERGGYISYANCGLPYYIGDVIQNREDLLLQTPLVMKKKLNIDVRIYSEVLEIHTEEKAVTVKNLETGEVYKESYDNLIISTGSTPLKPPIPGIDGPGIFTLWNVPDTDRIKAFLEEKKPAHAVVIGGGFIGLEMAENLHKAGVKISLVEMQNQVMAPFDFEMAQLLHENMEANGVDLILGDGVSSFESSGSKTKLNLSSGRTLETDLVILSIGVKANSALAKEAGLALNQRGGIVVDDYMKTSDPNIYAVGDVIEVENFVLKNRTMIPLAGPANKQARICADNIVGDKKTYNGTQGTAVAQVFDLVAASVGLSEKVLISMGQERGKDYEIALINQKSHAGYYPGATQLTMKMIFDMKGRILGAQGVGQEGVDKRIDTLSAAMRLSGTIYDLEELEFSYAPPFSSAKDPVNMLGFVAENILRGHVSFISYSELDAKLADPEQAKDIFLLDITEDMERMLFSIPGSTHIPQGELRGRLSEVDKTKSVVVYCTIGVRSYNASRVLAAAGFEGVKVLEGGTSFYKSMHYKDFISKSAGGHSAETGGPGLGEIDLGSGDKAVSPDSQSIRILNCCGMQCPGPIMKVNEVLSQMRDGEILEVAATDMGFARDVESWCVRTGNTFLGSERKGKENIVKMQKGTGGQGPVSLADLPQGKTLIVFSGDLDKVLASFIIANGAAAMGRPVTMFFTFWGLNALRKSEGPAVKKPFIDKMFGAMMPKGAGKLTLSKMHMAGMGTAMMKKVMQDKNVSSLPELIEAGMKSGIKMVACTMSMDVMGITKEELIDGVELAGVASYLGDAEMSNVNLFI